LAAAALRRVQADCSIEIDTNTQILDLLKKCWVAYASSRSSRPRSRRGSRASGGRGPRRD